MLSRLSCAARRGGRPLFLAGASGRVSRLLRLLRLDRHLEVHPTTEALLVRLRETSVPAAERGARWTREAGDLEILLPEQFEGLEAWQAEEEFGRRSVAGGIRNFSVDGRRLRYIDSSGLRFLKSAWEAVGRSPGAAMCLRSFPETALAAVRREGLGAIPVESSPKG